MYSTKQRKILIDYLEKHTDERFTARQLADALDNEDISVSAVYRNLSQLEAENRVRRCSTSKNREVFFQYTDNAECKKCLHLSCKICGRTYHMDNQSAELFIKSIAKNDMFAIDKADTVIYGICKDCNL